MVAAQTSRTTSAWRLALNLRNMPLHMKFQIKAMQHNTNLIPLVKQVVTYNFAASLFCTRTYLFLGPFWTMVAGSCPKIGIVA